MREGVLGGADIDIGREGKHLDDSILVHVVGDHYRATFADLLTGVGEDRFRAPV